MQTALNQAETLWKRISSPPSDSQRRYLKRRGATIPQTMQEAHKMIAEIEKADASYLEKTKMDKDKAEPWWFAKFSESI